MYFCKNHQETPQILMKKFYLIAYSFIFLFFISINSLIAQEKRDSIKSAENILLLQKNKNQKKLRYLQLGEKVNYKLINNNKSQKGILEAVSNNSITISGQKIQFNEIQSISGQATKIKFTKNTGQMITTWGLLATGAGAVAGLQSLAGVAAVVTPILSAGTLGAGLAGVFLLGTPILGKQKFRLNEKWEGSKASIDPNSGIIVEEVRPDIIAFNFLLQDSELTSPLENATIEITDSKGNVLVNFAQFSEETLNLNVDSEEILNIKVSAKGYEDSTFVVDVNNFDITEVEQALQLKPEKVTYEINISDIETEQDLELGVILTNKNRDEQITLEPKDMVDGKYKVDIRSEDSYEMEVRSTDEYFFFAKEINTAEERKTRRLTSSGQGSINAPAQVNIQVTPLKVGAKLRLENISFAAGSATLDANAQRELDRVVYLLEQNPNMQIEIGAHTDDVGSYQDNLVLSQQRATSVLNYLQNKNIDTQNRCVSKAYGSSQPIVPNNSEANRAKNRRFEIKIIAL